MSINNDRYRKDEDTDFHLSSTLLIARWQVDKTKCEQEREREEGAGEIKSKRENERDW